MQNSINNSHDRANDFVISENQPVNLFESDATVDDNSLNHIEKEVWFDTVPGDDCNHAAVAVAFADTRVPFTEDCYRCLSQFIKIAGRYSQEKLCATILTGIIPALPANILSSAYGLWRAFVYRENFDIAVLQTAGLASRCFPENQFSEVADFIRDTVSGWMQGTVLREYITEYEYEYEAYHGPVTALAVATALAGFLVTDVQAPQRIALRLPVFVTNLCSRALCYWRLLENIASAPTVPSPGEGDGRPPFRVETSLEIFEPEACSGQEPLNSLGFPQGVRPGAKLRAFSSNSTVDPLLLTPTTAASRAVVSGKQNDLLPERLHGYAVNALAQKSGLTDLYSCRTHKIATQQQDSEGCRTYSYFGTDCGASGASPALLLQHDNRAVSVPVSDSLPSSIAAEHRDCSQEPGLITTIPTLALAAAALSRSGGTNLPGMLSVAAATLFLSTGVGTAPVRHAKGEKGASHEAERMKVPSQTNKANKLVIRFLRKNSGVLALSPKANGPISKEKMLSAVAVYLSGVNTEHEWSDERVITLARKILSSAEQYGGEKAELLSTARAAAVVRQWVFSNVLNKSPSEFIALKINSTKGTKKREWSVKDLRSLLSLRSMMENNYLREDQIVAPEDKFLHAMWHRFLIADMPFLHTRSQDELKLNSDAFASLWVGSRFLQPLSSAFSPEDAIRVGDQMWSLAIDGVVTGAEIAYFEGPALFALASSDTVMEALPDRQARTVMLQRYLEVKRMQQDITRAYESYQSAMAAWLSKNELAEKIIHECEILPSRPDLASGVRSASEQRKEDEKWAKQLYLNDVGPPCEEAPANLDNEYVKLTSAVADSAARVDKYLLQAAISTLPHAELAFLANPGVIIRPVEFNTFTKRYTMNGIVCLPTYTKVQIMNAELIAVIHGKKERIYAVQHSAGSDGYRIIHVGRDVWSYIDNGLLNDEYVGKYSTVDSDKSELLAGNELDDCEAPRRISYRYSFNLREEITSDDEPEVRLADVLAKIHRNKYYEELYRDGNRLSDIQEIWNIVKHIIPFYTCVEGIVDNDPGQAVPACVMDFSMLLPVIGQAAGLSAKFATGISRGALMLKSQMTLEQMGVTILRATRLPTLGEMASLGTNALRAVDPGVELLGGVSRTLGRGVVKLLTAAKGFDASELAARISKDIDTLPSVQQRHVEMLRVPDVSKDIELPVIPVEKYGRKAYVMYNPESGEAFGPYHYMTKGGQKEGDVGVTHLSETLEKQITADMYAHVDSDDLSVPDRYGLRRDKNGNRFLKVKDGFVKIKKLGDNRFSISGLNNTSYRTILRFKKDEFRVETVSERLKYILQVGLSGKKTNAVDILMRCGYTKESARSLLDEYDFEATGLRSDIEFAIYIEQMEIRPQWAEVLKKNRHQVVNEQQVNHEQKISNEHVGLIDPNVPGTHEQKISNGYVGLIDPDFPDFIIPYHLGETLAEGVFGTVYIDADKPEYLIKTFKSADDSSYESDMMGLSDSEESDEMAVKSDPDDADKMVVESGPDDADKMVVESGPDDADKMVVESDPDDSDKMDVESDSDDSDKMDVESDSDSDSDFEARMAIANAIAAKRAKKEVESFRRYYGEGAAEYFVDEQNKSYIRMLRVPGETLNSLPEKSLPEIAVHRYLDSLESMNRCGIMHDDLHNDNILWDAKSETFFPIDIGNVYDKYFKTKKVEYKIDKNIIMTKNYDDVIKDIISKMQEQGTLELQEKGTVDYSILINRAR